MLIRVLMLCAALAASAPGALSNPAGAPSRGVNAPALYHNHCSVCHGDRGDGRSRARTSLVPPPRDFTDPSAAAALPRALMIAITRDGKRGTAMVGWKAQLSDAQIEAVVDFIRAEFMRATAPGISGTSAHAGRVPALAHTADMSLPLPRGLQGNAQRGARFYAANCATCHGTRGDGQGPRAYFINPKPRNFVDPAVRGALNRPVLFAAIAAGRPGTEMPAWNKVIGDQEIADVAEYVFRAFVRPPPRKR